MSAFTDAMTAALQRYEQATDPDDRDAALAEMARLIRENAARKAS